MRKPFDKVGAEEKYRPDIDGLRAIAIMAVVAFHAFPSVIKGGFVGVDIFFVISGFLISNIVFEGLDRGGFSPYTFYVRRIIRIFPALIIVMLSCLVVGWMVLVSDELNQIGKHTAAGAFFSSNFLLWGEVGYFDKQADLKPLLHLWSLAVEEQFYIFSPLIFWLFWNLRFRPAYIFSLFIVLSFVINIRLVSVDSAAAFYSPISRIWEILSGGFLAWWIIYRNKNLADGFNNSSVGSVDCGSEKKASRALDFLSLLGLFLLIYGFFRINKGSLFPGFMAVVPVSGAVCLILSGSRAFVNRCILSSKVLVWIGMISYPIYLWHWPLFSFFRIVENGELPVGLRCFLIFTSVVLAWLTFRFVEYYFRFSIGYEKSKALALCGALFSIGAVGFLISNKDFSDSHGFHNSMVVRKGFEHAIGSSLYWYKGVDGWLFLGNAYDDSVAKLKLAYVPDEVDVSNLKERFSRIVNAANKYNSKVSLVVGPDKSSVYPEYLPGALVPSRIKYSSYFFEELKRVPNLFFYDPTGDLALRKDVDGLLYWATDTHWNNKGAFVAFHGLSRLLGFPVPEVRFELGAPRAGDLLEISGLKNIPLNHRDNWEVVWKDRPVWKEYKRHDAQETTFGAESVVVNDSPLSDKYIWVVGDSFALSLRQYFNSTFKEVRYLGHWSERLDILPSEIEKSKQKPDIIVVVMVERSF